MIVREEGEEARVLREAHLLVDEQIGVRHRSEPNERPLPTEHGDDRDARSKDDGDREEAEPRLLRLTLLEIADRLPPEEPEDEHEEHHRNPREPDHAEEEVLACAPLLETDELVLRRVLVDDADPLVMEVMDAPPRIERDETEDARDETRDVVCEP